MISVGDIVTGVPANERLQAEYPTVTGTYEKNEVKTPLFEFTAEYVRLADGTSVDCNDIQPASRRDKITETVNP